MNSPRIHGTYPNFVQKLDIQQHFTVEPHYNVVCGVHCKWLHYSWSTLYRNVLNSHTIRAISMLFQCIAPQLSLMALVLLPNRHHHRHFLVLIVVLVEHWKWSHPPSFWTTLVHSRQHWSRRSPLQTKFVNQFSDWEIWGPKIYCGILSCTLYRCAL